MNRLIPNGQQQPTADDPHAAILMPKWARVVVIAEVGTRFRSRMQADGTLVIFVREAISAVWPKGTPPMEPGEREIVLQPGQNSFQAVSDIARYADHQFSPSSFDNETCRICATPARKRWRLEVYTKSMRPGEADVEVRWFDDLDEALTERSILAGMADVLAVGMNEALYREEAEPV
jgi:hypothetical protein